MLRVLLGTFALLVLTFIQLVRFTYSVPAADVDKRLDQVYSLIERGQILSAKLLDEDARLVGRMCKVAPTSPYTPGDQPPEAKRCPGKVLTFRAAYPHSDVSTQQLIDRIATRAPLTVEKQIPKAISKIIITFVFPLMALANLFGIIFLSTSGESSISDIVGFGRIGRKRARKKSPASAVTFADVAGAEEAVTELREVTEYLTDPQKFEAYGAAAPKGVLLFGSPGCGKTLLARAVAGESGVPFFSISGADFVESLVGVGAARVRDLFAQVREVAPAIVFIDEIDAVGRRREGEGMTGGEREQTVNQLLVEMDGFEVTAGIVVMGATNRPDILDPALLRPGRFDRHVTVSPPDLNGRRAILELHAKDKPLAPDVDFELLARRTPGFTGADLANVINEGALLTIREGAGAQIGASHLSEAVLRVLHGPQRRGVLMTAEERKRLAFHESGHALVAAALGQAAEVHRVSIVARGAGLGQSMISHESDRVLLTVSNLRARLTVAMAGLTAEELQFGESSTTADDDIEQATQMARQMVGRHGMSANLGRMRMMTAGGGYLGGDTAMDVVSGQTMHEFDLEVRALLEKAEQTAADLLTRHRSALEHMAARLEEQETLEASELQSLLAPVRPEMSFFDDDHRGPEGGSGGNRDRDRRGRGVPVGR